MGMNRPVDMLEEASLETMRAVGDDKLRGTPRTTAALRAISKHLFDEGFKIGSLASLLGCSVAMISRDFSRDLGVSPRKYLTMARLETASRLLRDSGLSIADIAQLVGYSDSPAFRVAFKRWLGLCPSRFRALANRVEWPDYEMLSRRRWRSTAVEDGKSESGVASGILKRNSDLVLGDLASKFEEALVREVITSVIKSESGALNSLAVSIAEYMDLEPFSLLETLGKDSIRLGRTDRHRGVALADFSVKYVQAFKAKLPSRAYGKLDLLARSRLGNAYRLACNFPEANKVFNIASRGLWVTPEPGGSARAEFYGYRGALRLFERRFEEAELDLNVAIRFSKSAGLKRFLVICLLQRSSLYGYWDKLDLTLRDLEIAEQLQDSLGDNELSVATHQNLALVLSAMSSYEEAISHLKTAATLVKDDENPLVKLQLSWVRALFDLSRGRAEAAESFLLETCSGLLRLGESGYRAVISLELALFYFRKKYFKEATRYASEALAIFESLRISRESIGALELLSLALVNGQLKRSVILRARNFMRRCQWDKWA